MAQTPDKLIEQAQAVLPKGSSFFPWGGRDDKYQHAADLYTQAANAHRLQKNLVEAGEAFESAADAQLMAKEPDDAANSHVEAFKAYRTQKPDDAERCLQRAIGHWTGKGNLRRAATHQQNLGEMWEQWGRPDRAFEPYRLAAEWFDADNAQALANKLWIKVAELNGLAENYEEAMKKFEEVAKKSVGNSLMRFSVKDYLLKAYICALASQVNAWVENKLKEYVQIDPSFQQTREYIFATELRKYYKENESKEFGEAAGDYDTISTLDSWKVTAQVSMQQKEQKESLDMEEDYS